MHLTDEQIIEYALGVSLGEPVRGAEHIAACAECRSEVEAYVWTLETVRDNLPQPPKGYAERLWAAIEPRLKPRR